MKRLLVLAALLLPLCAQAAPGVRKAALAIPVAPAAYPYPGAAALINMYTAPQNAFNNAAWTKTVIQDTTFATKTLAPDGTQTASKMIEGVTANSFHILAQKITRSSAPAAGVPFRFAIDVKEAGRSRFFAQISDNAQVNGVSVMFDVRAGVVVLASTAPFGAGYSIVGTSVTPIGNGFYRCIIDFTPTSDTILFTNIIPDNGGGTGQYTGDGVSGLYIWQTSMLPIAAWKLGRRTFFDDFTYISPDTGNTQGPGFKWYVGNWPSAVHDPGDAWRTFTPLVAGDFSLAASILTIATSRSGSVNFGVGTAAASGAGQTFVIPALFRCSLSFNPANQLLADTSWPICWSASVEFMNGTAANNVSAGVTEFIEDDFFEGGPTANAVISDNVTLHDWTITGSGSAVGGNFNTNWNQTANWPFTQATWNTGQHIVASLRLSAASNAGFGLKQMYVDGIYVKNSEITWTSGTGALPGATSSNPTGIFMIGENQKVIFMLGAGPSRPALFDFVDVWQQ